MHSVQALREDLKTGDMLAALTDLGAAVPEYQPSRRAWQQAAGASADTPSTRTPEERVA